jgi:hypothetical protein
VNSSGKKKQVRLHYFPFVFYIENILSLIWKPCTHTFSPAVVSKCFRIWALLNCGDISMDSYSVDPMKRSSEAMKH